MSWTAIFAEAGPGSDRARHSRSHQRARDFARSIALLGAALLAALYSSSVAREGRIAAAALATGLALLIAGWVALRLVPRLAAGVEWERIPVVSRYRVTREGYIYILSVCVVAVAAVNTSNNLLYLVLSALLAFIVLSVFLSGVNFRLIDVGVKLPEHCFAKQPFGVEILLGNEKRAFPTFSLRLEPTAESPFAFASIYLPVLGAREAIRRRVEVTLPRRGRYGFRTIGVRSRFPFGFLSRDGTYDVEADCVVFPEILPPEEVGSLRNDSTGPEAQVRRGHGADLYLIRDYQPSDSARRVDWKASAKTSSLKSREFAAEDSQRIVFALDRHGLAGDEARFERIVSHAASHAVQARREGAEALFVSDEWTSPPLQSESALEEVLHYLALVVMDANAPPPSRLPGEPTVVFSLRSAGNI